MKYKFKAVALFATGVLGAGIAQASLIADGPGLVYDNVANVTWSSDANLFGTMAASDPNLINQIIAAVPTVHDTPNGYDTPSNSGNYNLTSSDFNSAGHMDWFGAMAWAKYLDSINYLGHNTWIQPTTYNQSCIGFNCTNSMLGELFYTGLGGTASQSITTSHNASYSLFTNVQNSAYWSGTEYASYPGYVWLFETGNGVQTAVSKSTNLYSWAVLPGQAGAAAVPEPGSMALFGLGVVLLGVVGRRRGYLGA
ncbi:MAG: DUF1566 domain-containing protein [Ferrovum sp.]|jgi:hypothetical protein|nr:DUF1566 domain-containing protein [Ferrovum sp.]